MISRRSTNRVFVLAALLVLLLLVLTVWWVNTPAGIIGKARAVGYSVCHQIESHSISIEGKVLPLCARCTGMFLGTLVSLFVFSRRKRHSAAPSKGLIAVLVLFLMAFVFDGLNSMLGVFPVIPQLYSSSNLLRLITGLMMGMVIASLLIVLWRQTWLRNPEPDAVLRGWKDFFVLVAANALAGLLVWLKIPLLYYPIAVISTGAVVILLGMIYSLIWVIMLKKENTIDRFSDGLSYLIVGLATAFIQIGLLDLLRFTLTGTWQGFQL